MSSVHICATRHLDAKYTPTHIGTHEKNGVSQNKRYREKIWKYAPIVKTPLSLATVHLEGRQRGAQGGRSSDFLCPRRHFRHPYRGTSERTV